MPEIDWTELDTLIHKVKGTLNKCSVIELTAKKLREEASEELEEMHRIVLKQVNGEE